MSNQTFRPTTPAERRVLELIQEYRGDDLSVADALCDRHPPDALAMTVTSESGLLHLTFGELRERSERLAAGLASLGVGKGSRVAALLPKGVELPVTLLAIWRLGAVYVPLFTAFAAQALALRLEASGAEVVVCDAGQRSKLVPGPDMPADPDWRVVTVGQPNPGDVDFAHLADNASRLEESVAVGGEGAFIQLYTSGTTGKPKGVVVPARALAAFVTYLELGLDVHSDDVYWNAADPGWAYGLYYAVVAPFAAGRRTVLQVGNFAPASFLRILDDLEVTHLAAAPTAFRAVRTSGLPVPADLALRAVSSAGEPLTPDVLSWSENVLGAPCRDHFGQTEIGMAIINGHNRLVAAEVRPGSMGRAMPGFTVVVLEATADAVAAPGAVGRVAIDVTKSPLFFFTGYDQDPERTAERYAAEGRYYLTGDSARMDDAGYVFFNGRDDDIILSAGYRIGPFDIESVLAAHDAVGECVVIGVPDPVRGEVIKAFIVLRSGIRRDPASDEALAGELRAMVRVRYAAHAYPRQIEFVEALPKTPSGKIQRFLLRA